MQAKLSNFALLAGVCLSGIGMSRSVHAQAYSLTGLGPVPGDTGSHAIAINNSGQVVGWSSSGNTVPGDDVATLWNGGTPTALGPGHALAINNYGEIAGSSLAPINGVTSFIPTLWSGGSTILLAGRVKPLE